jgi:hypothetical protein
MKQATFTKMTLLDCLNQLQDNPADYLTIYVKLSSFPLHGTDLSVRLEPFSQELTEALGSDTVLREAQRRGTGLVIFWSRGESKLIVFPPFPIQENKVVQGRPDISPLHHLLEKERLLGIMLINWGSYAGGIFRGDKLAESKIGTGYIHKRQRKGGSSAQRFARRTLEQKKDFLRKVAHHFEEVLKGYATEQIFFGGNRLIFKPLLQESPYLESQVHKISRRFLNVRYADREALLKSLQDINESLVLSF